MQIGQKIQLKRDIDRYPHFIANKGECGYVVEYDSTYVAVQMELYIEGCEEWDNCICWYEHDFEDFADDVEVAS